MVAQASTSTFYQGLAPIGPALRAAEHLSLGRLGILLGTPTAGFAVTLLLWGRASDRFGERAVMTVGLVLSAAALAVASVAHGLVPLGGCLFLAGTASASVNAASGRAVLHWFPDAGRGFAMGVRQTALPLGAAAAALALPPVVQRYGVGTGLGVLAACCLLAAAVVALWIREAPTAPVPVAPDGTAAVAAGPVGSVLRDRRLWRLAGASSMLVACQFTLLICTVEVLHGHRAMSLRAAGGVFALAQVLGAAGRLVVGFWSDRARDRIGPLRTLAVAMAVGALALAACVDAPVGLLVVVLVAECVLVICWNGLAFTAAGELASRRQTGTALGFQNTANYVSSSATPPLVGFGITTGGYALTLALVAVPAAAAAYLLTPLRPRPAVSRAEPGSSRSVRHGRYP